jgi:hypothetical protein
MHLRSLLGRTPLCNRRAFLLLQSGVAFPPILFEFKAYKTRLVVSEFCLGERANLHRLLHKLLDKSFADVLLGPVGCEGPPTGLPPVRRPADLRICLALKEAKYKMRCGHFFFCNTVCIVETRSSMQTAGLARCYAFFACSDS